MLFVWKYKKQENDRLVAISLDDKFNAISNIFTLFYDVKGYEQDSEIESYEYIDLKEQVIPWGIDALGIEEWTSSFNGEKVKVAIIDSGINKNHEDLFGRVVKEFNAIDQEEPIVDEFGHGTAIAGIIGARHDRVGIVGVAPNVDLYDVKVLNEFGKGDVKDFITAIDWCIEQEVDIINISFGYQTENTNLKNAIDRAVDEGIIIVAAAGNTYGFGVDYPAKYENVLSISSVNKELKRPSSAARGKIDFVAPGVDILTTNSHGSYSYFTGTSYATAYATGMIALMLQEDNLSKTEVISILRENALDLGEDGYDREYGHGLLQIN